MIKIQIIKFKKINSLLKDFICILVNLLITIKFII